MTSNIILFEDIFVADNLDPDGKKLDKVTRVEARSHNLEMSVGDKFTMAMSPMLTLDGTTNTEYLTPPWPEMLSSGTRTVGSPLGIRILLILIFQSGDLLQSITKRSAHERLLSMLVDIATWASVDKPRGRSQFVVVTKLSDSSALICRLLGSLKKRGCHMIFAVPVINENEARCVGITVFLNQDGNGHRIPVWRCPHLFGEEPEPEEKLSYFIEAPRPDAHSEAFHMPTNVDTCVFWDVEDYPCPLGLQLRMFYDNIKSAVSTITPCQDVSIRAYVVNKESELFNENEDTAGISFTVVREAPADKLTRLAQMIMDFHLWSMDNPASRPDPRGPNLVIITKLLEGDDADIFRFQSQLVGLTYRGHHVFLVLPNEKIPPPELPKSYNDFSTVVPSLSWEDLSSSLGKHKAREDTVS